MAHYFITFFEFFADLVIFNEEIINGKIHFLYSIYNLKKKLNPIGKTFISQVSRL